MGLLTLQSIKETKSLACKRNEEKKYRKMNKSKAKMSVQIKI